MLIILTKNIKHKFAKLLISFESILKGGLFTTSSMTKDIHSVYQILTQTQVKPLKNKAKLSYEEHKSAPRFAIAGNVLVWIPHGYEG